MGENDNNESSGWGAFGAFKHTKDTHGDTTGSFSVFTVFFILLALFGIGYYTYLQVYGAATIGGSRQTGADLETGLVGHWTFDGDAVNWSSTTAEILDSGSAQSHGNASNMNQAASQIGKLGQSLYFDGVNDYVIMPYKAALSSAQDITYSFWLKPDLNESIGVFGSVNGEDGSAYNSVRIDNNGAERGQPKFSMVRNINGTTINRQVQFTLSENIWFHVVYTYDGAYERIYVDGVQLGEWSQTGNFASNTEYGLVIGTSYSSNPAVYKGYIDDVRIYNRSLSANEAVALYRLGEGTRIHASENPSNLETGLVAHWTFDGPDLDWTSTTAEVTDRSGYGTHGNINNFTSSQVTVGKIGQALVFDGTNDYITANTFPSMSDYTYSAWINPSAYTNGIVSSGDGTYFFDRQTGSQSLASLKAVSGNYTQQYRSSTGSGLDGVQGGAIVLNRWQHVVWGKDGSDFFIYVDGVKDSKTAALSVTPDTVRVGSHQSGSGSFGGKMDDVRVYNRVLSADEVAQLYALGGGSTIDICREDSVQDADGNTYNTIAIGSQCWLDRNMDVGTRINISTAQTDNGTIEKYCYSDSDANCTTNNPNKPDGGLYQWNEAMQYSTTEGAQGICPTGFHIPTDAEWYILEKFLTDSGQACSDTATGYRCAPAGTKLQPGGSSRFGGNRAGFAYIGSYFTRGSSGYWWSSSPSSGGNALVRYIASGESKVYRAVYTQVIGLSVRCLQD